MISFISCGGKIRNYQVVKGMLEFCQQNLDKFLDIKKFTPFDWDTLYIVYGDSFSELLEWDYNIVSPHFNVTSGDGYTLYFVLKRDIVYIENINDDVTQRKNGDYVSFLDKTFEDRRGTRSAAKMIVYENNPILTINKKVNISNTSHHEYEMQVY